MITTPKQRGFTAALAVLDDRYEIDSVLDQGGMAVVYSGRHRKLHRPVAIKVLREEYGSDERFRKRFVREAQTASKIDHPNVIEVLDFGQSSRGAYLVMELLEGEDLRKLVTREGALPWLRAQKLLLEIAAGIAATHEQGVIHRDIKPGNCFLQSKPTSDGCEIKLLDFGVARIAEDLRETMALTTAGEVLGTGNYMAPELAMGQKADVRSDVYALGILAYELVTGQVPFSGRDEFEVLTKHIREAPVPPSQRMGGLPKAVDDVIGQALAKDPKQRYASVSQFGAAIAALSANIGASDTLPQSRHVEPGLSPAKPAALAFTGVELQADPMGPKGTKVLDVQAVLGDQNQVVAIEERTMILNTLDSFDGPPPATTIWQTEPGGQGSPDQPPPGDEHFTAVLDVSELGLDLGPGGRGDSGAQIECFDTAEPPSRREVRVHEVSSANRAPVAMAPMPPPMVSKAYSVAPRRDRSRPPASAPAPVSAAPGIPLSSRSLASRQREASHPPQGALPGAIPAAVLATPVSTSDIPAPPAFAGQPKGAPRAQAAAAAPGPSARNPSGSYPPASSFFTQNPPPDVPPAIAQRVSSAPRPVVSRLAVGGVGKPFRPMPPVGLYPLASAPPIHAPYPLASAQSGAAAAAPLPVVAQPIAQPMAIAYPVLQEPSRTPWRLLAGLLVAAVAIGLGYVLGGVVTHGDNAGTAPASVEPVPAPVEPAPAP